MSDRFQSEAETIPSSMPALTPVRSASLQCQAVNRTEPTIIPPIVYEVLRSPGRLLEPGVRTVMESCFGCDFSHVRVHNDERAASSARAVNARAYTVGQDIIFDNGEYAPETTSGRSLLSHELAHVVQQQQAGQNTQLKAQRQKSAKAIEGKPAAELTVGGSPIGLYRWTNESEKLIEKKENGEAKVRVPLDEILGKSSPHPTKKSESREPVMPSRIPIPWLSSGKFSLGLRLGFPEAPKGTKFQQALLRGSPDPLKRSLQQARILKQTVTGKVPSGWEGTNKSQLAKAIWGIFSKNIAPDLASKIAGGLSTHNGPGGLSYELDLILITNFSKEIGGGTSLTVRW